MKELKRILTILMIVLIIGIMALPTMAWDGYPNTPISDRYDDSYIYQVIYLKGTKIWLVVSQTPFYRNDNQYGMRIRTSSNIYMIQYVSGNWEHWGSDDGIGSTQGVAFDEILQSTHDIYMDSSLTNVFFSATRKTPMQETLTQHPPLILMSPQIVGLIPYLIGLLIVSAAFLKGLQLLFRTLRKA